MTAQPSGEPGKSHTSGAVLELRGIGVHFGGLVALQDVSLTAGYSGTLNTSVQGLAQSSVTSVPLVEDDEAPFNANLPAVSDATTRIDTVVPAGIPLVRFATARADAIPPRGPAVPS